MVLDAVLINVGQGSHRNKVTPDLPITSSIALFRSDAITPRIAIFCRVFSVRNTLIVRRHTIVISIAIFCSNAIAVVPILPCIDALIVLLRRW